MRLEGLSVYGFRRWPALVASSATASCDACVFPGRLPKPGFDKGLLVRVCVSKVKHIRSESAADLPSPTPADLERDDCGSAS